MERLAGASRATDWTKNWGLDRAERVIEGFGEGFGLSLVDLKGDWDEQRLDIDAILERGGRWERERWRES